MSATPDSTLADTRRSKADLQRENAELRRTLDERTRERDEALQRETAAAEVLGVINSSPGDLAPVFDAMLEKAMRLCDAAFGVLWTFEGELGYAAALRGVPPAFAEFLTRGPHRESTSTGNSRLRSGEPVLQITDITDDEAYRSGDPVRRALVELGGGRTMLAVPLRKDAALLGSFIIYRQEVRPFTDKQIALLQNFAAQAVIAMENARLITETREALDQQTATAEVLQVINSSPGELGPVFDAILEKAHTVCGATLGALALYDGEQVRAVATRGYPEEYAALAKKGGPPQLVSAFQRLLRGERLVHVPDAAVLKALPPIARAAVEIGGVRTSLSIPLRREGKLLGYISAHRQEVRLFSEQEIALLENFAAQAVIAIENARLIIETREALEQQTATAEVLGVINSSPGDLAPVFDAILEKAHALCGATFGSLQTYDGEFFRTVASRGLPDTFLELVREPFRPDPNSFEERLVRGDDLVHIPDVTPLGPLPDDPLSRTAVKTARLRTLLLLPLRKEAVLVGYVASARSEVRPFTDKQIALLQNFAAQAVIAMENARLLEELRASNEEIAAWNRDLEARVATQLAELERTGKLRRFLAPQLADLIIAQGDESILESHRREIVVVFCDVRGFTAFAERAEPEEVMAFLRDYHTTLGPIVARFEGTLDHYSGDGVMVFFNDPLPTPEPAKRAIEMAVALREAAQQVLKTWRRHGHDLGFGVGISQGYATLGQIGFAERMDYTAIGTVCNLAARLCDEAKDGQILISRRVAVAVEEDAKLEEIGEVSLKGLSQAVAVYNVLQ